MKKIFVLNGLPESGKTTFGKVLGEELARIGINFLHTSSIDPVKEVLLPEEKWTSEMKSGSTGAILRLLKKEVTEQNWDGHTKDDYWRKAMSDLKFKITEWNKYLIPDLILSKIALVHEPFVAFVDIREPNNIRTFKEACQDSRLLMKVETVLIESDKAKRSNNRSDESVYEGEYDYVIKNDRNMYDGNPDLGLKELTDHAHKFIEMAVLDRRQTKEIV